MLLELLRGEREVYTTFSAVAYANAARLLATDNITFRVKVTNTGAANRCTSGAALYGVRTDLETQYQIFVKKGDYDLAVHCLSKTY